MIGFVDTGMHPDSPVFALHLRPRRPAARLPGALPAGRAAGTASDCNDKIVGARHFVDGFGADRLRAGADVSPYDDDGHGTQLASLAAGNADVNALDGDQDLGTFSGRRPTARLAVYKACWSAPDPDDDGCSTADVVAAVDEAVADGSTCSTGGGRPARRSTPSTSRCSARPRPTSFVVAAAGNTAPDGAGHAQPWVTTVGGTTGPRRTGSLDAARRRGR